MHSPSIITALVATEVIGGQLAKANRAHRGEPKPTLVSRLRSFRGRRAAAHRSFVPRGRPFPPAPDMPGGRPFPPAAG